MPLVPGMPNWPGDPPLAIEKLFDLQAGDAFNLSALRMGLHTGTHMDAPNHFIPGGTGLEAMPLDTAVGPAQVIELDGDGPIDSSVLQRQGIGRGQRILFKTRNSERCSEAKDFCEEFVHLAPDGARWLAKRGVRLVGIDYFSVSGMDDAAETHTALLSSGVWILEGLNLRGVPAGPCYLLCLPLRIPGWDGAPARALLCPESHTAPVS